jgi:hypothetical protein
MSIHTHLYHCSTYEDYSMKIFLIISFFEALGCTIIHRVKILYSEYNNKSIGFADSDIYDQDK